MKKIKFTLWGTYLLIMSTVFFAGCSNMNPIAKADSTEQQAYAVYGTYVLFLERAADIAEDPRTPHSVKVRLLKSQQAIDEEITQVLVLLEQYAELRQQYEEAQTREEQLVAISNSLNVVVLRVIPMLDNFIHSVRSI